MTATPSRRTVLVAAAAGTAAAATSTVLAPPAQAAQAGPTPVAGRTGAESTAVRLLSTENQALHLLRRATYGPTPWWMSWVERVGTSAWLEAQLKPATIADPTVDAMLAKFPRLKWSIRSVWDAEDRGGSLQLDNYGWGVMQDLLNATIGRALWSRRQLNELMVEFWSNHFNVPCPNGDVWDSRHLYDARLRTYAMGKFSTLLRASAKHPAMLTYLNQADSSKEAPNENFARESLELHTVGVDGGYDEEDVYAAARLLTGLTLRNPANDGTPSWTRREFYFDASQHHTGGGSILGYTWPSHAAADGLTYINGYLNHLARHRKTAEHIALKLGRRFVDDDPPAGLVQRLADVYQANDTAIVPVLRALFTSSEFADAGPKVRRPYEDVIAGLRAIGVLPSHNDAHPADGPSYYDGLQAVYWQLREMGHAPFGWMPPDGYPDTAKDWASTAGMLGRWNTHRSHVNGWWPSASDNAFTWKAKPKVPGWKASDLPLCRALIPVTLPATYGGLIDVLCDRLLQQRMLPEHREAVAVFFGRTSSSPLDDGDAVVRWQFGDLVSLVLDSPYHALR